MTAAERARTFAKAYVNFVEALQQEGVPEETAREEARWAALTQMQMDDAQRAYDPALGPCPTCRRG